MNDVLHVFNPGLVGDQMKKKGVVGDKVRSGTLQLLAFILILSAMDSAPQLSCAHVDSVCADGGDPLPVCRACSEEVSRTWQDTSDGATLPRKLASLQHNSVSAQRGQYREAISIGSFTFI